MAGEGGNSADEVAATAQRAPAANADVRRRHAAPGRPDGLEVRPAGPGELSAGLRLLLGEGHRPADDAQVLSFTATAVRKQYDLSTMRVVSRSGGGRVAPPTLVYAVLTLVQPGGVALVLTPGAVDMAFVEAAAEAVRQSLDTCGGHVLAQALVDGDEPTAALPLQRCGFEPLATLLYLHRTLHGTTVPPPPPSADGRLLRAVTYAPETHGLFRRALLSSYIGSQDCPRLSGVRDVDDVLAGHRAAGVHDPKLWTVLCDGDEPAAVVLLSPTEHEPSLELVYLGVSPAYRHRGLGHWCLRHALHVAESRSLGRLVVAVDAENRPALKLYYRFGLKRFHRRLAMFRLGGAAASGGVAGVTA